MPTSAKPAEKPLTSATQISDAKWERNGSVRSPSQKKVSILFVDGRVGVGPSWAKAACWVELTDTAK